MPDFSAFTILSNLAAGAVGWFSARARASETVAKTENAMVMELLDRVGKTETALAKSDGQIDALRELCRAQQKEIDSNRTDLATHKRQASDERRLKDECRLKLQALQSKCDFSCLVLKAYRETHGRIPEDVDPEASAPHDQVTA